MTTAGGAIPLGARPISGGHYQATWSIRPGVRVHILVPAEAYAAGALAVLGDLVIDRLNSPHGVRIDQTRST